MQTSKGDSPKSNVLGVENQFTASSTLLLNASIDKSVPITTCKIPFFIFFKVLNLTCSLYNAFLFIFACLAISVC